MTCINSNNSLFQGKKRGGGGRGAEIKRKTQKKGKGTGRAKGENRTGKVKTPSSG